MVDEVAEEDVAAAAAAVEEEKEEEREKNWFNNLLNLNKSIYSSNHLSKKVEETQILIFTKLCFHLMKWDLTFHLKR